MPYLPSPNNYRYRSEFAIFLPTNFPEEPRIGGKSNLNYSENEFMIYRDLTSNLNPARRTITNPVVHDERGGLHKLLNADRSVESPNDPNWVSTQQAPNSLGSGTTQNNNVFQRSDPDYQTLKQFIRSDGTVDINAYKQ